MLQTHFRIFNTGNVKKGEKIKCRCGDEVFEVLDDIKTGEINYVSKLKILEGYNFKEGDVDVYCKNCGVKFTFI